MKKVFKIILVLAVVLGTSTSYANEVVKAESAFNYVNKGNHISVSDAFGEVIYSGEVNYSGNLITLYDFTQLKNGMYDIEVTNGFKIEINTIEVKDAIVSILEANKKVIHKPVVRNKNSSVLITKLALDGADMEIELYFDGNLIHTETLKGQTVFNRVYKLDDNLRGNYTTIIKSNNRVFIKNFSI
ncbi:hypothetical protein [uncultured Winogradskyella sp.]|uniref:hypothetical protein n=1 Tax=uncultured Winogradskyella sp. TaxID=395353 RepID=UPI002627C878|nr:hypothetical protein [uncultured Winogradskyella sp.]|tara:strand:+ start:243 stop:800 length:558 start_codon:yes stop_codon:yes gene_type:complete